jgi:hypothetical protein
MSDVVRFNLHVSDPHEELQVENDHNAHAEIDQNLLCSLRNTGFVHYDHFLLEVPRVDHSHED